MTVVIMMPFEVSIYLAVDLLIRPKGLAGMVGHTLAPKVSVFPPAKLHSMIIIIVREIPIERFVPRTNIEEGFHPEHGKGIIVGENDAGAGLSGGKIQNLR